MAAKGQNISRVFGEVVQVEAWRTPFDGHLARADLHVRVAFEKNKPIGPHNHAGSPVTFTLSLKEAEVHLIGDSDGVTSFVKSSVMEPPHVRTRVSRELTEVQSGAVDGGGSASLTGVDARSSVSGGANFEARTKEEEQADVGEMTYRTVPTTNGYAFCIRPRRYDRLDGRPWAASEQPVVKLTDTKLFTRTRGEPPSVRIEVRCRSCDLILEELLPVDTRLTAIWHNMSFNKKLAAKQYIMKEIMRLGLYCENIVASDFAYLAIADAIPSVEAK